MPGENAGEESAGECRSLLVQSPGAVSYSGWRPLSSGRLQRRESELHGILSQGYRPVKNTVQNTIQSLSRTLCKCVATLWSSPTAWHYALSPCPSLCSLQWPLFIRRIFPQEVSLWNLLNHCLCPNSSQQMAAYGADKRCAFSQR